MKLNQVFIKIESITILVMILNLPSNAVLTWREAINIAFINLENSQPQP